LLVGSTKLVVTEVGERAGLDVEVEDWAVARRSRDNPNAIEAATESTLMVV
jgi:hypothetical protein